MPVINIKKHAAAQNPRIIVSNEVKDYSNDPGFQKHNEMARAFIAKHGLPKVLYKQQ